MILIVSRKYYCIDSVSLYDVVCSNHTSVRTADGKLKLHFIISCR